MTDDITRVVLALPSDGGAVGFYTWDAAEYAAQIEALRGAAYRRRMVVLSIGGGNGHNFARLVPVAMAPVRCCSGTRGRGREQAKVRRARRRLRAERVARALRYRDACLRFGEAERAVFAAILRGER